MKLFLAAAVAALAFAPVAPADLGLEAKLPTQASVTCTRNTNLSYADSRQRAIYLSADECAVLSRKPSLNGNGWISFASAVEVLYHEWWHVVTGETDEQSADTGSLIVLRHMLRTYWGMDAKTAQKFYMQAVGTTHYRPDYRPTRTDPLL